MVRPANEGDVACGFEGVCAVAKSDRQSVGGAERQTRFGG